MAQLRFGSAGVTAREIDLSGPVAQQPVGVPAGVIGTSLKGPAFVPVTVGTLSDWYSKFGLTDGKKFGPLAVTEWLRNRQALTYVRVLGIGDGTKRATDGSVNQAGYTVGENEPRAGDGALFGNTFANSGSNSVTGRTYFLGAFMSESAGSTVFSSAGLQSTGSNWSDVNVAVPIVRGVVMAASGVILRLSSSVEGGTLGSAQPSSSFVATDALASGTTIGSVVLLANTIAKQEFVMILNGHQGLDPLYPNVVTASFDMTAPNYFGNVLNKDPYKLNQAGHYLYAQWDVHPATAVVTGSGLVAILSGAGSSVVQKAGVESAAFLTTSSLGRNVGSATVPNYETFTDRFESARSPWVISQKFGGVAQNLFRLLALDAGAGVSTLFKVSVENIAPSTDLNNRYGSFDVILRAWNDQDGTLQPLEQWRGVNLDPSSDRYIAKVIGDLNVFFNFDVATSAQKIVVDGNYPNRSNYVRVEVSTSVDNATIDSTALPFGMRGALHLITSGTSPLPTFSSTQIPASASVLNRVVQAPVPLRSNITQGSGQKIGVNPLLYWGVQFEHVTSLTQPNLSTLKNNSLLSFATYFPEFATTNINFVVGDNAGVADTATNGILDSDRFNLNAFTLENIQVITNSAAIADPNQWQQAAYVRNGSITTNDATKIRRVNINDFTQANRRFLKYSFFMQGGFDGTNLFDRDETEINNNAVVADMADSNRGLNVGPNVVSYAKAVDIMANVVNTDLQLLAIPGIRAPVVTDNAALATKSRFDALYIMDIEQVDNLSANITSDTQLPAVQLTTTQFKNRAIDNSFAAAYFPDVIMPDPNTLTNVVAPPSVAVLGALALNDAVGHPWFAPAGFTRGALQTTQEARVKLSKTNMDTLYDSSINPLVAFPGNASSGTNPKGGVLVWGQKTLQAAASALDRVNVRRLLIDIRRQVKEISQTIIFEPNRDATLARFSAAVTPRLQRIQALAGLDRFKVVIDSSTTSQADIENNTIRGKIFVQPTKSIELVSIDFVVTNNINQQG